LGRSAFAIEFTWGLGNGGEAGRTLDHDELTICR